jgi:RNA polymerase sigma factor (sigma-70 family)
MFGVGLDTCLDMSDELSAGRREEAARRRRFEVLYAEHHARVLGYVLRRIDGPDEAADALAETFLIAWRRLGEVPDGERSRLWLYAVARRVLANHRRGLRRRSQLADRLREELSTRMLVEEPAGGSTELAAAFGLLSEEDRELLRLQGWEGLDAGEIAVVLGCSRNAARIRLHRARRRLQAVLEAAPLSDGSAPPREDAPLAHAGDALPATRSDRPSQQANHALDPIGIHGESHDLKP